MDIDNIRVEVETKLLSFLFETDSATDILRKLHKVFPLKKAKMPKYFKGTHHLTMKNGKLVYNIWWKGQCWTASFNDTTQKQKT